MSTIIIRICRAAARLIVASFFLAHALPGAAQAQSCSATVTDIDFGDVSPLASSPIDTLATLTVSCTRIPLLTVVKMCPNIGDGSGSSRGATRLLRSSSGQTLGYQLYQDSSRTQGWGALDETDIGTVPSILLGGGLSSTATASRTIFARLFGNQTAAPAGSYISIFSGSETAFTFASYLLGATSSCTGFVGTAVIRPTFEVSATASSSCSISSSDLSFGNVGVLTSAVTTQTTLRVACTQNTSFALSLDGGIAAAPPTARRMTSAAGVPLTYGIYQDAARRLPWGDTSSTRVSGTGTGAEQTIQVYGLVPIQTTPAPGIYSDRVVATVVF